MSHPPLPRKGILALIALCAVWGYTWVILKEGMRFADPWDYATLRTLPGAILLFAIAAVLTRRWRAHLAVGTFALTAWQMLFGGLVLAVAGFFLSARPVEWTPYFWFLLIYATLFGTVLGWALWFYVLKLLPAGVAGLAVMAVPAIGVLSSRLQLGEQPGTVESAGMLLIGASLAVLSWAALRNRAAARNT